jgi:hypothetical protein
MRVRRRHMRGQACGASEPCRRAWSAGRHMRARGRRRRRARAGGAGELGSGGAGKVERAEQATPGFVSRRHQNLVASGAGAAMVGGIGWS